MSGRRIAVAALVGAAVATMLQAPASSGPGTTRPAAPAASPEPARHRLVPAARPRPRTVGHIVRPLDPADPAAGEIRVGYELYPATGGPARGTVLAIEGGPGYATTDSRDYYLELVGPLAPHRNLLLIDARGTGRSGAIDCPPCSPTAATTCATSAPAAPSSATPATSTAARWRPTTSPPSWTLSASPASTCTATPTAPSSARPSRSGTPTGCARSPSTRRTRSPTRTRGIPTSTGPCGTRSAACAGATRAARGIRSGGSLAPPGPWGASRCAVRRTTPTAPFARCAWTRASWPT